MGETPVGRILAGEAEPRPSTLVALCSALGVTPSWVLMGLRPAYIEDLPAQPLQPVEQRPDVERWLEDTPEGQAATEEERGWLRAMPWPAPAERQPDHVYQLTLLAYRQSARPTSSTTLQPVDLSPRRKLG
jgi:hypothetical protein